MQLPRLRIYATGEYKDKTGVKVLLASGALTRPSGRGSEGVNWALPDGRASAPNHAADDRNTQLPKYLCLAAKALRDGTSAT
jgi:hypothetical protein